MDAAPTRPPTTHRCGPLFISSPDPPPRRALPDPTARTSTILLRRTPRFTRRAGLTEARTLQGRPQPARSGESSRSGQSEPALLLAPAPALWLRGPAGPPERRRRRHHEAQAATNVTAAEQVQGRVAILRLTRTAHPRPRRPSVLEDGSLRPAANSGHNRPPRPGGMGGQRAIHRPGTTRRPARELPNPGRPDRPRRSANRVAAAPAEPTRLKRPAANARSCRERPAPSAMPPNRLRGAPPHQATQHLCGPGGHSQKPPTRIPRTRRDVPTRKPPPGLRSRSNRSLTARPGEHAVALHDGGPRAVLSPARKTRPATRRRRVPDSASGST